MGRSPSQGGIESSGRKFAFWAKEGSITAASQPHSALPPASVSMASFPSSYRKPEYFQQQADKSQRPSTPHLPELDLPLHGSGHDGPRQLSGSYNYSRHIFLFK